MKIYRWSSSINRLWSCSHQKQCGWWQEVRMQLGTSMPYAMAGWGFRMRAGVLSYSGKF